MSLGEVLSKEYEMPLSICQEVLIRTIFTIIKFWFNHIFLMLIVFLIAIFLSRSGIIMTAILATIIDFLVDISNSTLGLFTAGIWAFLGGALIQILLGSLIGILWVAMLWYVKPELVPLPIGLVIKTILTPFFFIFGFIIGVIPLGFTAVISFAVGFILTLPLINTMFLLISTTGLFIVGSQNCSFINSILSKVSAFV